MRRRSTRGALWCAALLPACALHLRAPEPDPRADRPVAPADRASHVSAVARVPFAWLASMVERQTGQPIRRSERAGFADWSLDIGRDGPVTVRAADDRLCLALPFRGEGRIATPLGALQRPFAALVELCAVPRLEPGGALRLDRPVATVRLERPEVGGPGKVLADIAAEHLQAFAADQLAAAVAQLRVPADDVLGPVLRSLDQSLALGDGACVRLRPSEVRLAQPGVDADAVRMSASLVCLPTVEQPCARGAQRPMRPPPIEVVDELQHPLTHLTLPIGVGLERVESEVAAALQRSGRIAVGAGWVEVKGVRLHTARGALLVRAAVVGEVHDRVLGLFPVTRQVVGEVALWGKPLVDATTGALSVEDLQVDLATDDTWLGLAVALQRSQLHAVLTRHLRIDPRQIDAMVRQAVEGLGRRGVRLGAAGDLPVRVDVQRAHVVAVHAVAGRLELVVAFEGRIVIGSTAAN
ncbi:MAG: DUF4403 family protein [Myxococcales bacterium]|nr:DUF4403 family protein [Myxococcales bacterium]